MKPAVLHFFLFLLFPFLLQAQSNYKPGFVVTLEGDTLRGFIDYKEWANTPTSVSFREVANSGTGKVFDIHTARYFEITGLEAYQRFEGSISMNPVALDRLTFDSKPKVEPATIFLKLNYQGDLVNLLSYSDNIKTRFFFQEKDGSPPQELYFSRYRAASNSNNIVEQKSYVGQLLHLAAKLNLSSTMLNKAIEASEYTDYDLENLFSKINTLKVSRPAPENLKSNNTRYLVGLGINSSQVRIRGVGGLDDPDNNPASFMPCLSFGADIFLNKHIQKLFLRVEGVFTASKYQVAHEVPNEYGYTNYAYKISQQNFIVSPQLIYTLYNQANFKLYAGALGQFNLSNYNRNVYTITITDNDIPSRNREGVYPKYLNLMPFWFSYAFRTGMVLQKRYDVNVVYMPYAAITQYNTSSVEVKSLRIGINYLFHK